MATKKAVADAAEKKPVAKKPATAKAADEGTKAAAKKPAAKKPAEKKPADKKAAQVIIQSPLGGEITPETILARVGDADRVYVKVDENKAYWVRGEETGSIDLW